MPSFAWQAVDAAGTARRGMIDASSAHAARAQLREQALLPTDLRPAETRRHALPFRRRGLSPRQLATATRQLSTLIASDVNVEQALDVVARQADAPAITATMQAVRAAIMDGRSLAGALARVPDGFPEYYRASVAAGEQSGRLADVLLHLADFVEARARNARTVRLALMYPALLACVSIGMVTLLLVYVVPDIVRVFVSRGADLPFLTRALIALSEGVRVFGPWIAIAGIVGGFALTRWLRVPANRLRWHRFLNDTPPFRRFSRQHNAARFAATLATLVQSAVPLTDALAAAAAVTPNLHVRQAAEAVGARVREGSSLAGAMADTRAFPTMLVAIVASGEGGGRLGPALGRAADELDRELDALTTTLVALVEPAVLLLMGGVVLLMVLAILLPIIDLNNLAGL